MRKAPAVILSVAAALGFACTGEDDAAEPKGGTATGGSGGDGAAGSSAGGGSGRASGGGESGNAGAGGNANGGAGGDGSGAVGDAGGEAGTAGMAGASGEGGASALPSVFVFSRTLGYRHESIADGVGALQAIAAERGWGFRASEDPNDFSDEALAPINVVVFLSTTGDVLDVSQEEAFERYVRAGGGFVGIHSASDTEYDWPFYGGLLGVYFREHPQIQEAVVHVEDAAYPATAALPNPWRRTDEWYAFRENPRPNVHVLLTLDESSYAPGTATMGADHPIAWFHEYEGGRAFYTALGHTRESYAEAAFLAHLRGALEWAAGARP